MLIDAPCEERKAEVSTIKSAERSAVVSGLGMAVLFLTSILVIGAATGTAHADDCAALGGVLAGGECQIANAAIASDSAHGGPFTINETLRIKGTGSITVPPEAGGASLTLIVTGNVIMDLPTVSGGSRIIGDNPAGGGVGATVAIQATGDITLIGNGTIGAQISAN